MTEQAILRQLRDELLRLANIETEKKLCDDQLKVERELRRAAEA